MIQIKQLKKYYGTGENKVAVLKGVDLEIEEGKLVCLLGPSGAGKSTLLNIIGGIETIDGGSVVVSDTHLEKMKKKALESYRRDMIGFVFQFYNLIGNLTLRENILTGAYLSDDPLDIDDIAEKLGLEDQLYKFPSEISGGQAQRTSIARAMIKRPKILIADEPTGALDYENAKKVLELIEYLNEGEGITVFLATHNTQIAKMCHIVVELRDGEINHLVQNEDRLKAKDVVW